MTRSSHCSSCSCAGFCNPFGKEWMLVTADNALGAAAGQMALLLGALIGTVFDPFNHTDLSAVAVGLSFVVLSFLLIKKYAAWKYGQKRSYRPSISEVLNE